MTCPQRRLAAQASDGAPSGGFTLIELMVATLILLGGVTAVLQLFSVGVATRRSADARERAVHVTEATVERVIHEVLRSAPMDPDDSLPRPENIDWAPLPEVAGLEYSVRFVADLDRIDLLLAVIQVRWRQEGARETQTFRRVVRRHRPFPVRVAELRETKR